MSLSEKSDTSPYGRRANIIIKEKITKEPAIMLPLVIDSIPFVAGYTAARSNNPEIKYFGVAELTRVLKNTEKLFTKTTVTRTQYRDTNTLNITGIFIFSFEEIRNVGNSRRNPTNREITIVKQDIVLENIVTKPRIEIERKTANCKGLILFFKITFNSCHILHFNFVF